MNHLRLMKPGGNKQMHFLMTLGVVSLPTLLFFFSFFKCLFSCLYSFKFIFAGWMPSQHQVMLNMGSTFLEQLPNISFTGTHCSKEPRMLEITGPQFIFFLVCLVFCGFFVFLWGFFLAHCYCFFFSSHLGKNIKYTVHRSRASSRDVY